MDDKEARFALIDYVIFALMLVFSSGIGIFYAVKDRKRQNTEAYLLAGRVLFGCLVAFVLTAQIFMPVYYKCGLSTVNQYLEMRFHVMIKVFASVIYLFQSILYTGVVILAPSLALSTVTGLDLWGSAATTALVCVVYSSLGGLKAVLWSDSLQMVIMLIGLLSVVVKASYDVGGVTTLWERAEEGNRIELWKFDVDPRIRHTTWSVAIGSCFFNLALYSANQGQVQRYLSCRSLRDAKIAIAINYIGMFLLLSLAVFAGVAMYGYYHDCDPTSIKNDVKADTLMPYMVVELFRNIPGMTGLFTAAVYSGSLSTVSTSITAMSSVVVQDFLKPLLNCSESAFTWISRALIVSFGMLCLLFAYLSVELGGILQIAISVLSLAGAPLLVAFTLGIFVPFANTSGAFAGMLGGTAGTVSLFVGKIITRASENFQHRLPTSTIGCEQRYNLSFYDSTSGYDTFVSLPNTTYWTITVAPLHHPAEDLFALSYMYTTAFGFIIGMSVGVITSLLTGGWKSRGDVDSSLLCPYFAKSKSQKKKNIWMKEPSGDEMDKENMKLTEEENHV